ncbi:MAG TPA: flagellar assembly protein FliW [Calidithermus sp.]|nr:flagellar assembly protein FliW [Calidithermus sp.]
MSGIRTSRPSLGPTRLAVRFPGGLPGLPGPERFALVARAASAPFVFLVAGGRPRVTLPLLPLQDVAAWVPAAGRALESLGLGPVQRAYAVAAIGRGGRPVTVNLRAPVVVDLATRTGLQRLLDDPRLPLAARIL